MYVLSPTVFSGEGDDIPSCADQTLCACLITSAFFSHKDLRAMHLSIQEMIMH